MDTPIDHGLRQESDQLPEEAPGEQVPDDTGRPDRDEDRHGDDTPEGQASGHPDNAG